MKEDVELLNEYGQAQSEEAFAELVRRHLPLVYSAALRQVAGDHALAKDVAQTVFIDLARKAASLSRRVLLTGWLYTSTRFAASNAVRQEQRRKMRERKAMDMQEPSDTPAPEPAWETLSPVLDEAMAQLDVTDRNAVLLRFFEHKQLGAVGAALEISEDAARMRIGRALEKLRALLQQRGVTISATALSAALAHGAVAAAPAGLAPAVSAAALAGAAGSTGALPAIVQVLTMSKAKVAVIGAIVVGSVAVPLALKRQAHPPPAEMTRPMASLPPSAREMTRSPHTIERAAPAMPPLPALPEPRTLTMPVPPTPIGRMASPPTVSEFSIPVPPQPVQWPSPTAFPQPRQPRFPEQEIQHEMLNRTRASPPPPPPKLPTEISSIELKRITLEQLPNPGITNEAVRKAIEKVSHCSFALPDALTNAYRWTMESPHLVGYVAECLDPQPTDRVLQFGIGSGYEAAVLAELVQAVYSVEPQAELVQQARGNLERCGYTNNVFVRQGELAAGWTEASPFDKMVFNGTSDQFPTALIDQLKPGGRLVIATAEDSQVHVFEKSGAELIPKYSRPFVPVSIRPREVGMPALPQPLTSEIIKVPSAEELRRGARIEVIRPNEPGVPSAPVLPSEIIMVPPPEELKRGARIEPIQPVPDRMRPGTFAVQGLRNEAVRKAIEKVSHCSFVFPETLTNAYVWTMESPHVVGYVAECLDPQPTDRVLQFGVGSGYEAAVLAELVQAVHAVEPQAELVQQAKVNLERCGYTNKVFVRQADLAAGWLEASPFDKMVFNGSADQFSAALIDQLKPGGRLIIPAGEDNQVHVFEKLGAELIPKYSRPIGSAPTRPSEVGMPPSPTPIRRGPSEWPR